MITVRPNVFETNSSSEHCLTVEDGMRDIEEFPIPDDTGTVHIPMLRNGDDLDETTNFVSLVQYLVMVATECGGYEKLFRLPEADLATLHDVIIKAYSMAGIAGVEDVVLDPPADSEGICLSGNGYVTLWGGCCTEVSTMEWGLKSALERLAWYVKDNNLAHTLVKQYTGDFELKNYAAAALAMRTHGYFKET